jgi:hypothetical protein
VIGAGLGGRVPVEPAARLGLLAMAAGFVGFFGGMWPPLLLALLAVGAGLIVLAMARYVLNV